jgi:fumarate reductase subunit C
MTGQLRTYRARPSVWWWMRKRSYALFAMRELSSVFVAWFVMLTVVFVWCVSRGEERYERFLDVAANPFVVAINVVALAFLLLHTVTWFNLTPQAMPLRMPRSLGGQRVPGVAVVAAQWAAFAVVTALVVWMVMR